MKRLELLILRLVTLRTAEMRPEVEPHNPQASFAQCCENIQTFHVQEDDPFGPARRVDSRTYSIQAIVTSVDSST